MEKYITELKEVFKKARILIWASIGTLTIVLTSSSLLAYVLLGGVGLSQSALLILILIPVVSSAILFISLFVWMLFFLKTPLEPKKEPDPIELLIGAGHQRDILGEIYETYYYQNKNFENKQRKPVTDKYLMNLQEEVLRRFIEAYNLKRIGNPGEGPLSFNPVKHRAHQSIRPGAPVFITSIGWEKEGKTILPALVSTQVNE
jgi:hypothetical protein